MLSTIIAAYFALYASPSAETSIISSQAPIVAHEQAQPQKTTLHSARVTAYSLTGNMANGEQTYWGAIACPRAIPLGTFVTVGKLGDFRCTDRTALHNDGTFDLWVSDYDTAINFGAKYLPITIQL